MTYSPHQHVINDHYVKLISTIIFIQAWSSGRIQYFPFLFAEGDAKKNLLHQDHYNLPTVISPTKKARSKSRISGILTDKDNTGAAAASQKRSYSHRHSFGASSVASPLLEASSDEDDVIVPNKTSFRTTSFLDPPKADEINFAANVSEEPARLFSTNHRPST